MDAFDELSAFEKSRVPSQLNHNIECAMLSYENQSLMVYSKRV
jgi:hypothetical protein